MPSNGRGDARSGSVSRMRDLPSMPFDRSSAHVCGRPSFYRGKLDCSRRDKFDCSRRDSCTSAKTDWATDLRPSANRSSSETLFSDIGSLSPFFKRKAPGRRGTIHEPGRCESPGCRSLNTCSHGRSSQENRKGYREYFGSACGPSPGYSSSLSMERPINELDGTHLRDPDLSVPEMRPTSSSFFNKSPSFNPPTTPYGISTAWEGPAPWERNRSKFSVDETAFEDKEKYRGRHAYHKRTYSLPKIFSARDWAQGETEPLEGRIDRYGSASCRDSSITDKKHVRHGRVSRDYNLIGGTSSRAACTSISISHLAEASGSPAQLVDPRPLSSPYHDVDKNPLFNQNNHDFDAGPASPKKRRRLTWGQGLAKYEKEKNEKNHSGSKKYEDGGSRMKGSPEDVHASWDRQRQLIENGSFLSLQNQYSGREQDSCDSGVLSSCGSEKSLSPKGLTGGQSLETSMQHAESQSKEIIGKLSPDAMISKDSPFLETSLQTSISHGIEELLSNTWKESSTLSKDILTHHMETLELEIDCVKKELVNLNAYGVEKFLSTPDACSSKAEVHGSEPCDTGVSASERQLLICGDPVGLMVAAIPAILDHCGPTHKQQHEDADWNQILVKTVKLSDDDIDSTKVDDNVANAELAALQTIELQCESGALRSELEMTCTEINFSCLKSILSENALTAEKSSSSLAHLNSCKIGGAWEPGGLYFNSQQSDVWMYDFKSHCKEKKHFQDKVLEERALLKLVEKILAVKRMAYWKLWKQKQCKTCFVAEREEQHNSKEVEQGADAGSRDHHSLFELQFDWDVKIKELCMEETVKTQSYHAQSKTFLKMPAMILGRERKVCKFKTKNGLVEDPISAEQERKMVNPWSKEEKNVFVEKYSLFGKDFRKIASCLEHKTVADCVEFYYRNQKTQEFEKVRCNKRQFEKARRTQLEKYRVEQALLFLGSNNCLMDSMSSEDQRASQCLLQLLFLCRHSVKAPTVV